MAAFPALPGSDLSWLHNSSFQSDVSVIKNRFIISFIFENRLNIIIDIFTWANVCKKGPSRFTRHTRRHWLSLLVLWCVTIHVVCAAFDRRTWSHGSPHWAKVAHQTTRKIFAPSAPRQRRPAATMKWTIQICLSWSLFRRLHHWTTRRPRQCKSKFSMWPVTRRLKLTTTTTVNTNTRRKNASQARFDHHHHHLPVKRSAQFVFTF
jgi:hypothetical protein